MAFRPGSVVEEIVNLSSGYLGFPRDLRDETMGSAEGSRPEAKIGFDFVQATKR